MASGNPIWDVYNGLWGLLEDVTNVSSLVTAGKHFTDLVPSAQRIKFTSSTDRNPFTGVESSNDMPEVAIFHARGKPRDRRASNSTSFLVQWEVLIRSGDQRFDSIMDVEWAVFRQLANWDSLKTSITWNTTVYPVKLCDLRSTEDSMFDERTNQQLRGWRAIWVGETDLWFPHDTFVT